MIACPERLLNQAIAYARHGWPVFRCQPGSKEPATRHGFRDATTCEPQIVRWWQRQPHANLAIATGAPGPDVLDVDQHGRAGNGFGACHQLEAAGLLDAASAVVLTPNGGLHFYFAGSRLACGRLPRHHLDFRSAGGYVLAPPSQIDGKPYQLVQHSPAASGLNWSLVTSLLEPDATARPSPSASAECGLTWDARDGSVFRGGCLRSGRPMSSRTISKWRASLQERAGACGQEQCAS
ncbi:MAG TPA: bifunctional DNA primase/polymerase [Streptosporangiaceae bacterium]|nr:bifunctional DNA primase/polymerase [Streptosporangiaceae bacterium]